MSMTAIADRDGEPNEEEYTLLFAQINMHIKRTSDGLAKLTFQDWDKGMSVSIMIDSRDRETIIECLDGFEVNQ